MNLTEQEAIALSIKKWEYLAETGDNRRYIMDITTATMPYGCALCELAGQGKVAIWSGISHYRCNRYCPYAKKFRCCTNRGQPFLYWERLCKRDTPEAREARKKYAQLFLDQLKQLAKVEGE